MSPEETKAVVNRLFERFALRWTRNFLRDMEGLSVEDVKAEWVSDLQRFSMQAVAHAFNVSKDNAYPPSLPSFVVYCRNAPIIAAPPDAPKLAAPEVRQRNVEELLKTVGKPPQVSKLWAENLKARHEAGAPLHPIQIECYRAALEETA